MRNTLFAMSPRALSQMIKLGWEKTEQVDVCHRSLTTQVCIPRPIEMLDSVVCICTLYNRRQRQENYTDALRPASLGTQNSGKQEKLQIKLKARNGT